MRATPVEVVPPDAPSLTLDEWAAWSGLGELVDGRLVEEEVPDGVHETVVSWLVVHLSLWAKARGGRVFASGLKYGVTDRRGRMPDVSVWLDRRKPSAHGVIRVPPDIAVEVLSPTPQDARRDRIEKLEDYARFGVRWYWIVDPALRTLELLALRDGIYGHVGAARTGRVSEIPGCADLVLDLDDLWAEVDALE